MVNDIRFLSIHADCKMVSTVGVTVVLFFHDKISFCIGLHNGSKRLSFSKPVYIPLHFSSSFFVMPLFDMPVDSPGYTNFFFLRWQSVLL